MEKQELIVIGLTEYMENLVLKEEMNLILDFALTYNLILAE